MSRKPYRRFASLETEIVWAAVERLDIAQKHGLLDALTEELFVEPHLKANAPSTREARAVLAVREAAKSLGHSPSISEFTDLFERHPEYSWPHPSRVRAWLGSNSWNAALERAGLEACSADAVIRERVGSRFSRDSLLRHLQLAAEELEGGFTFEQYSHWVRRPDVVARHGLLARSLQTFIRVFGSWSAAYMAAGLRDEHVLVDKRGMVRYARHAYDVAEILKALKLVAKEIGHTPTIAEYRTFRKKLWQDSCDAANAEDGREAVELSGELLPSVSAVKRAFNDDWAAACTKAGLDDPGEAATAAFTNDRLLQFVVEALKAGCETAKDYDSWRDGLLKQAVNPGLNRRVPSSTSIRKRFKRWATARTEAEKLLEVTS